MAQQFPEDLKILSKSMLILLKHQLGSLSKFDSQSAHEKIYHNMIHHAEYCEEQNKIRLTLQEHDSLTHHKLYHAIQHVFKMKGPREIKNNFNLKITGIKFPHSRNKLEFPPVEISGQSISRTTLELTVSGPSSMIFVSYFLAEKTRNMFYL